MLNCAQLSKVAAQLSIVVLNKLYRSWDGGDWVCNVQNAHQSSLSGWGSPFDE